MRRVLALGSAVALVTLTGGGGAAADAGTAAGDGTTSGDRLTLYSTVASESFVSAQGEDIGEEGPDAGARILLVDTLYRDGERTDEVGRNDLVCTVTEATEEDALQALCFGVVRLDDQGSLAWSAAVQLGAQAESADEPFMVVAVTGGTQEFTGADGQVELFEDGSTDEGAKVRYEVDLSH